jgi:hypothetical protein
MDYIGSSMKVAMDPSVLDLFERFLNDWPIVNKEQEALMEIHKSGVRFYLLPCNIEELRSIKRAEVEKYLSKCHERELDSHKIIKRINDLNDPHDNLGEEEYRLLAEAEECGINIILTTNGNFIHELTGKSNSVKIMKPTDYFKK